MGVQKRGKRVADIFPGCQHQHVTAGRHRKRGKYPTPLPIRLIRERPSLDRHRFRTPVVQLDPIVKFGVSRYAGIRDPAGRLGLADEILPDIVRRDQDLRVFGDGLQRAKELESRVVGQPAIMRLDGEHIVAGAQPVSRRTGRNPFRASPKPPVEGGLIVKDKSPETAEIAPGEFPAIQVGGLSVVIINNELDRIA